LSKIFEKAYRRHDCILKEVPKRARLVDKIRAVLFDMGGTLVKAEPTAETYDRILKSHGIELPVDEIAIACERAKKSLDFKRMLELGASFWVKMNLLVLENLEIRHDALPLAEAVDREWWDHVRFSLYPEALTLLNKLKEKHVKIGIITNNLETDLKRVLSKLNLEGFFDIEASIDTVGKMKPEKEIFVYAVEKLGLQPKEALFIGDDTEIDYKGARKAGLRALLIDRENKAGGDIKKIRNLQEILFLDI
jgi:2-haloalkanoic acid dehalogenase type II